MDAARSLRRRMGGSMRQSGILAAAGLYALEHQRARLREDHENATLLAKGASKIAGLRVVQPETNIVMLDVVKDGVDATEVVRRMKERNVLITEFTATRVRAVTHLDVSTDQIERTVELLAEAMQ